MSVDEMLNVNEKIVLNNCTTTSGANLNYGEIHNHSDIQEMKKLYEQLLQAQKEKHEAQIELLKTQLKK